MLVYNHQYTFQVEWYKKNLGKSATDFKRALEAIEEGPSTTQTSNIVEESTDEITANDESAKLEEDTISEVRFFSYLCTTINTVCGSHEPN